MKKIHFIEFEWYKENILHMYNNMFSRCDIFATYGNTRLTGVIFAEFLSSITGICNF